MGYHLCNHGLEKRLPGAVEFIPLESEEDVFRELGLVYIPPHERNV
jgi:DNA polymerase/3'-5' exonuclease PolX